MGVSLKVYNLDHVIYVVNANFGSKQYIKTNVQYCVHMFVPLEP